MNGEIGERLGKMALSIDGKTAKCPRGPKKANGCSSKVQRLQGSGCMLPFLYLPPSLSPSLRKGSIPMRTF
jgi:hypothetical protein